MKQKNLTFVEAVKYLADKANIPINLHSNETPQFIKKREILYKINVETGRYYFTNLQKIHLAFKKGLICMD
ncbi:DNA primase [Clostridioides difficile]|nr:DNA primase [Clostridioides difficile]